ncbi:hypothetical protein [Olsenella sp. An293]|uniref:hypothetical protein n=1 Tax=Olsenella sp. An293 TaxID=1965626 RepID=UPI000B394C01|nr:hypothetical protein [Olsenella sp. An293]OUO32265.1 hypothetical protein B5F85_06945 [Olsenella sp. An293]
MREPRFEDYRDARDFFAAVREASREAERTRLTLLQMEAREGARAQAYAERVSVGGERDRMAQTDARIDYEERMRERIDEDYALLDLACRALYGEDSGKGGLDVLMGSSVADCMSFRYVDARPWEEVAALTGYSAKQCQRLCAVGLDACDFFGWANLVGGAGGAEG